MTLFSHPLTAEEMNTWRNCYRTEVLNPTQHTIVLIHDRPLEMLEQEESDSCHEISSRGPAFKGVSSYPPQVMISSTRRISYQYHSCWYCSKRDPSMGSSEYFRALSSTDPEDELLIWFIDLSTDPRDKVRIGCYLHFPDWSPFKWNLNCLLIATSSLLFLEQRSHLLSGVLWDIDEHSWVHRYAEILSRNRKGWHGLANCFAHV